MLPHRTDMSDDQNWIAAFSMQKRRENSMENTLIEAKENEEKKAAAIFTKIIDGRSFLVRVYFPASDSETMQAKIERMLHREIVNAIRQSAA